MRGAVGSGGSHVKVDSRLRRATGDDLRRDVGTGGLHGVVRPVATVDTVERERAGVDIGGSQAGDRVDRRCLERGTRAGSGVALTRYIGRPYSTVVSNAFSSYTP